MAEHDERARLAGLQLVRLIRDLHVARREHEREPVVHARCVEHLPVLAAEWLEPRFVVSGCDWPCGRAARGCEGSCGEQRRPAGESSEELTAWSWRTNRRRKHCGRSKKK